MKEEWLDLLLRSLDSTLSAEEQEKLQRALETSPELRAEQKRLAEMRRLIAGTADRQFKPFFSARVMRRLREGEVEREAFVTSLAGAFRIFATVGTVAIIVFLGLSSKFGKDLSLTSILNLPTLSIEDTWQLDNLTGEENHDL